MGNWQLSVSNRQLNRQPATSCQLPIRCRFVDLILSLSNLNRQPATSCQLPIRWTCLYWISNWISNWQLVASCRFVLVAGCRFVEFILSVSNLNRQPASSCQLPTRWTCLHRIGNWIGNRQLVAAGCRFVELILSVSNLNRQPTTNCQVPIRWTCLYRIGNWIGNLQLLASCWFVELVCIVSANESTTGNFLPVADSLNLYCLFRIWIGNRQLVASCRIIELVCIESATESATGD